MGEHGAVWGGAERANASASGRLTMSSQMTPSSAKQRASAVLSRRPAECKARHLTGRGDHNKASKEGMHKKPSFSQAAGQRVDQTVGLNAGAIETLTGWLGH